MVARILEELLKITVVQESIGEIMKFCLTLFPITADFGVAPRASNSRQQDYGIFEIRDLKLNFHLPLLLGGQPQVARCNLCIYFKNSATKNLVWPCWESNFSSRNARKLTPESKQPGRFLLVRSSAQVWYDMVQGGPLRVRNEIIAPVGRVKKPQLPIYFRPFLAL